ncbi:hypothetical protein V6N12_045971 [Hibiscus sabdariffa]|uniref:Uncharacterized protein n=1 Tax=Hibiscus sabdariffa TaxID=183260 RepID=A0ABR2G4I1_9ROSI
MMDLNWEPVYPSLRQGLQPRQQGYFSLETYCYCCGGKPRGRDWTSMPGFKPSLVVVNAKMTQLDLNHQPMEPHGLEGVEVKTTLISLEGSYVESLVLLDKNDRCLECEPGWTANYLLGYSMELPMLCGDEP